MCIGQRSSTWGEGMSPALAWFATMYLVYCIGTSIGADEPTSGLDSSSSMEVCGALKRISELGLVRRNAEYLSADYIVERSPLLFRCARVRIRAVRLCHYVGRPLWQSSTSHVSALASKRCASDAYGKRCLC
jgi:hypothetical protein